MRIFFKWAVFFAIVFVLQVAISHYFTKPWGTKLLDESLNNGDQILYFGDSVIGSAAASDKDKSSITDMLARLKPGISIADLSRSANHVGLFEAMIEHIARSRKRPEAVIIPINIRNFSPWYDRRPEFQFEKEIFYLTAPSPLVAYFYKPLAVFRAINVNAVPFAEYYQTPVYRGAKKIGTIGDFIHTTYAVETQENIASGFIFAYMFEIDPHHRQLESIRNMADLADRAGIKTYYYITPIDHVRGEKIHGEEFRKQAEKNTELVCAILEEKNHSCHNFAFSLNPDHFSSPILPSEHLNEKGRMFIAKEVAKMLSGDTK
jgi:hypothetical protein